MLGILCGFETEAKIARRLTPLVGCSGAVEENARDAAEELVKQGATTLLSFGLAGGLHPELTPQSVVIGDRVTDAAGTWWRCDETLLAQLANALPHAKKGGVYGSRVLVPEPVQKKILFDRNGCLIVDMESQIVAEVATRHGKRFGVLRGVSDTVEETFPPAALVGINPDGSLNVGAVARSLLKNPGQLPALLRLFKNTEVVLKNLGDAVPKILPFVA